MGLGAKELRTPSANGQLVLGLFIPETTAETNLHTRGDMARGEERDLLLVFLLGVESSILS